MALYQWSTTPASNATAGSINWAEGQAPSTVNDSARQLMADVATYMVDPQFYNYGDTPTYVSATQFTIPGNQTANYAVNRRIKATVTAGTLHGSISVSAYTSLTTVTVVWDSGSLDAGLSAVYLSIVTDKVQQAVSATSATSATTATTATNIAGGASGSVPYQSAANTTAMLAAGTNGQVLTLAAGVPAWGSPTSSLTSQATTAGASITFTGIPATAKRIIVILNNVQTTGTASLLVQIGAGSVTTTGYVGVGGGYNFTSVTAGISSTSGFPILSSAATNNIYVVMTIDLISANTYVSTHNGTVNPTNIVNGGGGIALAGALDRVVLTTTNGTDTFRLGSANVLYQ